MAVFNVDNKEKILTFNFEGFVWYSFVDWFVFLLFLIICKEENLR